MKMSYTLLGSTAAAIACAASAAIGALAEFGDLTSLPGSATIQPNVLLGRRVTVSSGLMLSHAGGYFTAAGPTVKFGLYRETAGAPGELVSETSPFQITTAGVNEIPFLTHPTLDAGSYWIMAIYNTAGRVGARSNVSDFALFQSRSYNSPLPNPLGQVSTLTSIRLNYHVVAADAWYWRSESGTWNTPSAWTFSSVPTANDNVVIDTPYWVNGAATVTLAGGQTLAKSVSVGTPIHRAALRVPAGNELIAFNGIRVEPNSTFEVDGTSVAHVTMNQGEFRLGGALSGDVRGVGTFRVDPNAQVFGFVGVSTLICNGTIKGDASANYVTGNGTFEGHLENAFGLVSPGESDPGQLVVRGKYTQRQNGTLNLRIRGTDPNTQFDSLGVVGALDLGGQMRVTLEPPTPGDLPFRPSHHHTFPVVSVSQGTVSTNLTNAKAGIVEAKSSSTGQTVGIFDLATDPDGLTLRNFRQIHSLSFGISDVDNVAPGRAVLMDLTATEIDAALGGLPGVVDQTLVTRTTRQGGNQQALTSQVNALRERVAPGDTVVIYLGTHGSYSIDPDTGNETPLARVVTRKKDDGTLENTLDSPTKNPTRLLMDVNASGEGSYIRSDEFVTLFRHEQWVGVNKLFIVDSCYAGGMWQDPDGPPIYQYLAGLDRSAILAAVPEEMIAFARGRSFFGQAVTNALTSLHGVGVSFQDLVALIEAQYDGMYAQTGPVTVTGGPEDGWGGVLDVYPANPMFYAATPDFDLGLIAAANIPEPASTICLLAGAPILVRKTRRTRPARGASVSSSSNV